MRSMGPEFSDGKNAKKQASIQLPLSKGVLKDSLLDNPSQRVRYEKVVDTTSERLLFFADALRHHLEKRRTITDYEAAKKLFAKQAEPKAEKQPDMFAGEKREFPQIKMPEVEKMLVLIDQVLALRDNLLVLMGNGDSAEKIAEKSSELVEKSSELKELAGAILDRGAKEGWLAHHGEFFTIRTKATVIEHIANLHKLISEKRVDDFAYYFDNLKREGDKENVEVLEGIDLGKYGKYDSRAAKMVLGDSRLHHARIASVELLKTFNDLPSSTNPARTPSGTP
jgi:hypothetical protein